MILVVFHLTFRKVTNVALTKQRTFSVGRTW